LPSALQSQKGGLTSYSTSQQKQNILKRTRFQTVCRPCILTSPQVYKEKVLDLSVKCATEAAKQNVKRFVEVSTAQVYEPKKVRGICPAWRTKMTLDRNPAKKILQQDHGQVLLRLNYKPKQLCAIWLGNVQLLKLSWLYASLHLNIIRPAVVYGPGDVMGLCAYKEEVDGICWLAPQHLGWFVGLFTGTWQKRWNFCGRPILKLPLFMCTMYAKQCGMWRKNARKGLYLIWPTSRTQVIFSFLGTCALPPVSSRQSKQTSGSNVRY